MIWDFSLILETVGILYYQSNKRKEVKQRGTRYNHKLIYGGQQKCKKWREVDSKLEFVRSAAAEYVLITHLGH